MVTLVIYCTNKDLVNHAFSKLIFKLILLFINLSYGVTIHSNRLDETIRMNGHTIGLGCEIRKFAAKCRDLSVVGKLGVPVSEPSLIQGW